MRLEGWNSIPKGYGATFRLSDAPVWLRLLHALPLLDRFSYPLLVRSGLGVLSPHPGIAPDVLAALARGWRLSEPQIGEAELRREPK